MIERFNAERLFLSMTEEEPEHQKVIRGGPSPTINLALSGNKLVYQQAVWNDVTDIEELKKFVHPTVAENISLKKRVEILVKLLAESRYQTECVKKDIKEAQNILSELKESTGVTDNETTIVLD